jgi:hypothetical protein
MKAIQLADVLDAEFLKMMTTRGRIWRRVTVKMAIGMG